MKVAVMWEVCGFVDIEADTMAEAMQKFTTGSDYFKLPKEGEYVDGSFRLSSESVEEMEAICNLQENRR